MNHPTFEVDELLISARHAVAADDYDTALSCLRLASSAAPLRKDVRSMLGEVLEGKRPGFVPSVALDSMHSEVFDPVDPGSRYEEASASTQTVAGKARKLSNILEQGLRTWKSSFVTALQLEPGSETANQSKPDSSLKPTPTAAEQTFAGENLNTVLDDYLAGYEEDTVGAETVRSEGYGNKHYSQHSFHEASYPEPADLKEHLPVAPDDDFEAPRKSPRKSSGSGSTSRKMQKSSDMEDILAAGIDSLIENLAGVGRRRFAFATVYVGMVALVLLACIQTSRQFHGVKIVSQNAGTQAEKGAAVEAGVALFSDPVALSRELEMSGKPDQAIETLQQALVASPAVSNREAVRAELVRMLDKKASDELTQNKLQESVRDYRSALSLQPNDPGLTLRLGNALFYAGTMSGDPSSKTNLSDAAATLQSAITLDPKNVHGHRMLAKAYGALGQQENATTQWKKVHDLAGSDSTLIREAETHLKKQK